MLTIFYAFIVSLSVALILVPFLRLWALEQGAVDLPEERKVHKSPTPRLGGIAVFLAFLFSSLMYAPFSRELRGILAGALVVFATGIADDLHGLSSRQKFFGQIVACLVTITVGGLWLHRYGDPLAIGPIFFPPWAGVPFTIFAVVGVTNAINLIDGLDGLAGGVSVLALLAFGLMGLLDGDPLTPMLAAALAGAVVGFLKYNFYPARIFMGDAGSMTVGFLLGFIAVQLTQRPGGEVNVLAPVVVLGLPVFDSLWVMARRMLHHGSPFAADRTHFHHKFLDLGFEHRFTVLVIYAISLFWACSAFLLEALPEYVLMIYLPASALLCYLGLRYLLVHRGRFSLLQRDTTTGLRQSVLFGRCAGLVDRTVPWLALLIIPYVLLSIWAGIRDGHLAWPVALVLCVGGLLVRFIQGDRGGELQMLLVYAACCFAAFAVWGSSEFLAFGISVKRYGDALLVVASLLVVLKLAFLRVDEFFLATADFLALTIMVLLSLIAQKQGMYLVIGGPLLRAILLMLATRTLASRGPSLRRMLVAASIVLLGIFALTGFKA